MMITQRDLYYLWEILHLKQVFGTFNIDCVFDIGANMGQYALMLRKKVGYRGLIISFEPIPRAAAALRELSLADDKWVIEECAISTFNGKQDFNIMADTQFSSLSQPSHNEVDNFSQKNRIESTITVATETLSSAYNRLQTACNFTRPFLKMDTQGHDVEIIKASQAMVKQYLGLQSELSVKKIYESSVDFREALTFYEKLGFSLSALVPNNAGHFPRLIEVDCIMLRTDLVY